MTRPPLYGVFLNHRNGENNKDGGCLGARQCRLPRLATMAVHFPYRAAGNADDASTFAAVYHPRIAIVKHCKKTRLAKFFAI